MKLFLKLLPWGILAFFFSALPPAFLPKHDGEFHVREFARLPVLLNGRIQPIDSVARNSLLQIRSTGDLPLEQVPAWQFWHHPKKLKSTEWLLELMTKPELADTRSVFLIHHPDLLGEFKLQDKGIEKSGLHYFSFNDLRPVLPEIGKQGEKASEVKAEQQTTFQKQVVKLANALMLYQRLKFTIEPEGVHDFSAELAAFTRDMGPAQAAAKASEEKKDFDKAALEKILGPLRDFETMRDMGYALVIPPQGADESRDHWQNTGAALLDSIKHNGVHPAVLDYAAMATAYHQNNPGEFNRALANYQQWLQPRFAHEVSKGRAEFFYNDAKPFLYAIIFYIAAFVLALGAILTLGSLAQLSESLRLSALYLVIMAGVVHTFGLVFRMALEGRPPVTNLYSSAIFIGWAAMVIGIIVERAYRVGLGSLVASLAGFVTLLIAYNLALGGDTMEMLRAVLDTNFWLATHVVVITLGYAATFFAGLLAILYIALGIATPLLSHRLETAGSRDSSAGQAKTGNQKILLGQALGKMVYGVVCFATLFSFIGTVLGGIWADQSWGRFWGWDPKENGALLIVLWNAVILHARWGGLVRDRGVMNMAVFGNIVTSFSWFGVNMLGIGLHSYGFMDAAFQWLMFFIATQVVIILCGLLPLRMWRSFASNEARPPKAPPGARVPRPAAA